MSKAAHAAQRLREKNIRFTPIRNGWQFIVDPGGKHVSFWPGSGAFYAKRPSDPPTAHLNGVEDLIKYIKGD